MKETSYNKKRIHLRRAIRCYPLIGFASEVNISWNQMLLLF